MHVSVCVCYMVYVYMCVLYSMCIYVCAMCSFVVLFISWLKEYTCTRGGTDLCFIYVFFSSIPTFCLSHSSVFFDGVKTFWVFWMCLDYPVPYTQTMTSPNVSGVLHVSQIVMCSCDEHFTFRERLCSLQVQLIHPGVKPIKRRWTISSVHMILAKHG